MRLLGRRLLEKPDRLGAAVETAFFKHFFTRYYPDQPSFSYWQDKKNRDLEVDLIAQTGDRLVPFEVRYQDVEPTPRKLKGLRLFLEEKKSTMATSSPSAGRILASSKPAPPAKVGWVGVWQFQSRMGLAFICAMRGSR